MGDNLMDGAGFHSRLFQAWSIWMGRHHRKLTQGELGTMIGRAGGQPVAQNTISGWFKDVVPGVDDLEFLAKALEVDPGWLAFGDASGAPRPRDPVVDANYPIRPPEQG